MSEDVLGVTFVGRSGKLLDLMIKDAGLSLDDIFFVNCVLCRPCDYVGGPNREPTKNEILICMDQIIRLIQSISLLEKVVLIGKIAERYWGREFPKEMIVKIQNPAVVLRRGGKGGPDYLPNVRALKGLTE